MNQLALDLGAELEPEDEPVVTVHVHRNGRRITHTAPRTGTARRCDACLNAASDVCSCRCGGRNHGTGWGVDFGSFEDEGEAE